jgi:D-alanyl-D-alanine carboxypeptidase (penicillin-binding protein 5/6)
MIIRRLAGMVLPVLIWLAAASPAGAAFSIDARAAVLMDPVSGRVLYTQNENQRLPPASVTKVMTMLMIMEAVDSGRVRWDEMVRTSAEAAGMGGSQVYLKEGEEMTLREMFKAIAVVSGNDASAAVAEHLYGSIQDFIDAMNERAKALKLENTHFQNETGLPDPNHYSSAYDLAVMSRELIVNHPAVLKFTSIWLDSLRGGAFVLKNTNDLLQAYRGADGLKTGHTDEAKFCLSATAQKGDFRLISVILGAASNAKRVSETKRLLDYGYRNFQWKTIRDPKQVAGQIYIREAQKREVPVKVKRDFGVLVERGKNVAVETKLTAAPKLKFPIPAGGRVGTIRAILDGKEIGQAPLFAVEKVNRANIFTRAWRWIWDTIGGWFGGQRG